MTPFAHITNQTQRIAANRWAFIRWTDIPTDDAVRQQLQVAMLGHADFHAAMCAALEAGSDEYPNGDDAITNIAYTFLARDKRIEDITDADAALIGWHMAEWFHKYALTPIVQAEQDIVAQRLDDEAAEREWRAA